MSIRKIRETTTSSMATKAMKLSVPLTTPFEIPRPMSVGEDGIDTPTIILREIRLIDLVTPCCMACDDEFDTDQENCPVIGVYVAPIDIQHRKLPYRLQDYPLCPWCGSREAPIVIAALRKFVGEQAQHIADALAEYKAVDTEDSARGRAFEDISTRSSICADLGASLVGSGVTMIGPKENYVPAREVTHA